MESSIRDDYQICLGSVLRNGTKHFVEKSLCGSGVRAAGLEIFEVCARIGFDFLLGRETIGRY